MSSGDALLRVRDLTVELRTPGGGPVPVVEGLSFDLDRGESLGLVGESGTGKSVTILALIGLLPPNLGIAPGSRIWWKGRELTDRPGAPDPWGPLRGREMGVLFQDPGRSLDPVFPVGRQVAEVAATHRELDAGAARTAARVALEEAGFREAGERFGAYAHELSGGERQRVGLAAALVAEPDLLLADEPTSALDAPVAAEVLDLLEELRKRRGTALLMVSHDLSAVARATDRAAVLYAGRIVEEGTARRVLRRPSHPYTRALVAAVPHHPEGEDAPAELAALPGRVPAPGSRPGGCRFRPRCGHAWGRCSREPPLLESSGGRVRCWLVEEPGRRDEEGQTPPPPADRAATGPGRGAGGEEPGESSGTLLEARGVVCRFEDRRRRGTFSRGPSPGVHGLDLALEPGEAVGLVGRSGSGKTTAARLLLRLRRPQAGRVLYRGRDVWDLEGSGLLAYRRDVQPVFQDPGGSLNPRLRVGAIVREPLEVHGLARGRDARDRARGALEEVGLDPAMASRYPRELSGGECQRVALARALLLDPRILVADEPTSALDVSVQAAILNLLLRLRAERGLGLLLISHDLGVIRHACRRVLVMAGGEVVERGPTERIFQWPQDQRTRSLVEAASSGTVAT